MKTISHSKVTNIAMVKGGEETLTMVILDGQLKQWVGIGWVDIREATDTDKKKYPEVV